MVNGGNGAGSIHRGGGKTMGASPCRRGPRMNRRRGQGEPMGEPRGENQG